VRVLTDGQTHTQTQTDFIICPMLYAIAMEKIIISDGSNVNVIDYRVDVDIV